MDAGFILSKPSLVSSLVLIVHTKTILSLAKGISPFTGQISRRHLDGDPNRLVEVGIGSVEMREPRRIEQEFPGKMILQPSPCVWAVLACCAPTNFHFRFGCFPYLGCSTLFWQSDPCQFQTVMQAAEEAVQFYQQFDKRSSGNQPTSPTITTNAAPTDPRSANDTTPTPTPTLAAEMNATTSLSSDPTTALAA